MRKLALLLGLSLLLVLSACGGNEPASLEETPLDDGEMQVAGEIDVKTLLEKMNAATEEIKSLTLDMNLNQRMYDGQEEMNVSSSSVIGYVQEPLSYYMQMEMELDESGETYTTEMYLADNEMYMYEPETDRWMMFPFDMMEEILEWEEELLAQFGSEYEMLFEFVDDFNLEVEGDYYLLTLQANEDKYMALIEEMTQDLFMGEDPFLAEMMEDLFKIDRLTYELKVSKETFLPVETNVYLEGTITVEDHELKMEQEMYMRYRDINAVEAIEVPEEVKANAEVLDFNFDLEDLDGLEGLELEDLEDLDLED
ncbi:outer membrane lipoprotein-sorting protein [Caldalkalibacillus uzonensis]|uniref:Outer membrane lipoprotein-sorting protein n=1 Tax=Caldalkalibacillus uzonensis TaxID=353224 RepID=A0ABU0CN70_9BACI|nr:DUF6612 family protein [Caldalkalibacillus uzonensis]MDQ0337867.1 outer membrane lipoprotein-sorting protein [Caldalkalibacillus uzonensis]